MTPASPVTAAQALAGAALRPGAGAIRLARHAEREARGLAEDRLGRLAIVLVDRALASPYQDEAVRHVLESPYFERLVARVVASRVVDEAAARVADEVIRRLPESTAMWSLVEEVAGSRAVTDAISRQGSTFADHVAEEVRDRSRTADARLEHAARRVLWRRQRAANGDVAAPVEVP